MAQDRPVVVTTEHRGVFFGYLGEWDAIARTATLDRARNCVRWSSATKGFLGLAATGPLSGSRVGPAAPNITLTGVTSVTKCTPEAAEKWESAPWG